MALEDAKKALAAIEAQVQPEDFGLVVAGVGGVEAARLSPWTVAPPSPGDITIQVRASALNYPDVMCVRGLYPTMPEYPFVPGFEVAGVVSAVGPGVACFAVGDEVIAVTGPLLGGHASKVNVPADNAVRKPATLTFEEACSLPVVFSTVYYAFEMGKLAEGEHVLVQTATGGCGLMALQLAHLKRCICHGSSSRDDKRKVLERIGVPHVIDYTGDFAPEIRNQTGGRGVDVVLNMVSGEAIQKGLDSLAPFGRYLEIAVHALKTSPKLDLSRLVQNQTLHSIDLRRVGFAGRLGRTACWMRWPPWRARGDRSHCLARLPSPEASGRPPVRERGQAHWQGGPQPHGGGGRRPHGGVHRGDGSPPQALRVFRAFEAHRAGVPT